MAVCGYDEDITGNISGSVTRPHIATGNCHDGNWIGVTICKLFYFRWANYFELSR